MWKSLQEGGNGVDKISLFDASNFPTKFAAEVKNFHLEDHYKDAKRFELAGRNIQFAVAAATQAIKDSGVLDSSLDPTQFGVYLGAGEGQQDFVVFMNIISQARENGELDLERFTKAGLEQLNPKRELEQEPNMPAGHLANLFNAQGPNLNCLDGVCRFQPGNWRGVGNYPPRRRRRDALRRRAQHDSSVRHDRLQLADGPVNAQFRSRARPRSIKTGTGLCSARVPAC